MGHFPIEFLRGTKILLTLLFFVHCEATHSNVEEIIQQDPNYGVKWMYMPDETGNPQIVYLEDPGMTIEDNQFKKMKTLQDNATFYLYRRAIKDTPVHIKMSDPVWQLILNNENLYDHELETKMIIHGWKNSYESPMTQTIKDAYLSQEDMNIIVVDWSDLANSILYYNAAAATLFVGQTIALFLDHLVSSGTSLGDIHLIGHSLGAHTAGFTGAFIATGKVRRITGLDPAKPGFNENDNNKRLDPSDAEFVDIIHTCAGILGINENLGHVDFWPNQGRMAQPGCSGIFDIIGGCSHARAYVYYAESIQEKIPFLAYKCESWGDFVDGKCNSHYAVEMGDGTPPDVRGDYFLKTGSISPFAIV